MWHIQRNGYSVLHYAHRKPQGIENYNPSTKNIILPRLILLSTRKKWKWDNQNASCLDQDTCKPSKNQICMVVQTYHESTRSEQAASAPCTDSNFTLIWVNIKTEAGDKTAPKKVYLRSAFRARSSWWNGCKATWHWYCLLCEYILPINLLETDTETTATNALRSWDKSIWTAQLNNLPGTWAVFPHLTSIYSQSLCRYHWKQWINCYLGSLDHGISHNCYLSVSGSNLVGCNFFLIR